VVDLAGLSRLAQDWHSALFGNVREDELLLRWVP
jgi:hypothetical protein